MDENQVYQKGCQLFDEGDYFEAHEIWEDIWQLASGTERAFLQGMIQVAVALCHAGNENWRGAIKLLGTAYNYLDKSGDSTRNIDLIKLKDLMLEFGLAVKERQEEKDVALPFFKLPYK